MSEPTERFLSPIIHEPTTITVDRYTLGEALHIAWKRHGPDSWCSIADDVIAAMPCAAFRLSLKQQALEALNQADNGLSESEWQQRSDIIRRALEALPDE